MQVPRPSEEDKEFFRLVLPNDERVLVKPMFGNLGAFVDGTMFAGLLGPDVGVRLSDEDRARLEDVPGVGPFGPAGRPMGAYLSLPAAWRDDPASAAEWVERAFVHVATLVPEVKTPAPKVRKGPGPG